MTMKFQISTCHAETPNCDIDRNTALSFGRAGSALAFALSSPPLPRISKVIYADFDTGVGEPFTKNRFADFSKLFFDGTVCVKTSENSFGLARQELLSLYNHIYFYHRD